MASAFSHAIAAAAIGKVFPNKKPDLKFCLLAIFCAVIPDADVIGFGFGIHYGDLFGHRGFTHSFFFALLLALCVMFVFYKEVKPGSKLFYLLLLFFFCCTASHPILDAMTNGGKGVAFFSPFSNERYFFPFRPVVVSPIGVGQFFSEWGLRVIESELLWIWIPSLSVMLIAHLMRKKI